MVAIVGPPNVGKSTLLNSLLGQKISIVSPKPQTTRQRIMGIVNGPDCQLVLLDTPGLHQARSPLNTEMMRISLETLREVDAILYMVDFSLPLPEAEERPFISPFGRVSSACFTISALWRISSILIKYRS